MNLFIQQVSLALTLIQGLLVAEWHKNVREWIRRDTGLGKPVVFGSQASWFRVRVKPEQTHTHSQPLPTVYGFSVGP